MYATAFVPCCVYTRNKPMDVDDIQLKWTVHEMQPLYVRCLYPEALERVYLTTATGVSFETPHASTTQIEPLIAMVITGRKHNYLYNTSVVFLGLIQNVACRLTDRVLYYFPTHNDMA